MKRALTGLLLILGMQIAASTAFGQAVMPVPDTGQNICYNGVGTVIPCPSPGEPLHGQDANYIINPTSYTDLGNDVVRDDMTGLYWEVKRNKDSVQNYDDPRDADNTYTWCNTNPATNDGNAGTCGDHDTMDFIAGLNAASHGGFTDWRMPTFDELRSIVDYGRYNPAINTAFFPNTVAAYCWSSTTGGSGYAWRVNFYDGYGNHDLKSYSYYVRAVRGGQPNLSTRYIDHGDGTVTDTTTGLMWQKDTARDGVGDLVLIYK